MAKLRILFFDAGGGHRNAANALLTVLKQRHPDWDISLINLQEYLDQIDLLKRLTGLSVQDGYNLLLRRGWTLGMPQLLVLLHGTIRLLHPEMVERLSKLWAEEQPDVVLSVIPNFNRAIAESLRLASPSARFITLITDFADYPPHFWIERESQYVICGTERAAQQAIAIGVAPEHVFRTSGMVLNPRFYTDVKIDRAAERQRIGLSPDLPTALILFGGHGAPVMVDIAERLNQLGADLQMILICGRSEKLCAKLKSIRFRRPVFIEGFTSQVDYYMGLSDFLIGKPGPGSISEALHFKLPVIVTRNIATMPQERFNAEWVIENRVGVVLKSFRQIGSAVAELLANGKLADFRGNAAKLKNTALFEAAAIVEKLAVDQAVQSGLSAHVNNQLNAYSTRYSSSAPLSGSSTSSGIS